MLCYRNELGNIMCQVRLTNVMLGIFQVEQSHSSILIIIFYQPIGAQC